MKTLLTPRKLLIRLTVALLVLVVVATVCAFVGTEKVLLSEVMKGPVIDGQSNPHYEIFVKVRLPRVLLAVIVGAALACAGVVFQAILRNPLADPYILGVSSGAGLGAMLAVVIGINWTLLGYSPMGIFAFAGAMVTVCLVWFVGKLTGKYHITGLLLAGVVVNAFFSAVIMFLTSITRSDLVYSTIFWLMGNMTESDFMLLWMAGGCVLAGMVALFYISTSLNALSFGESDAQSMGVNVARTRIVAFAVAAFITAVAVSLSGLIGFVGLVVPHAVRLVLGPDHRQLLPVSGIVGAVFLVGADTIARVVVAPAQLPVGVITALIGGPFFLVLLIRHSRKVNLLG